MNLTISNIAWTAEEDEAAYALLKELGVQRLEIAPGRVWRDPMLATPEEIQKALGPIRTAGLSVVAFQAILFGKSELTVFESEERRRALIEYLDALAKVAALSGAHSLVFGAPRNRRIPISMAPSEAHRIAVMFFSALGERASAAGVQFCLEPNPAAYDCNFATHITDTARLVRQVNSSGLRLQLDAGECAMNEELLEQTVAENLDIVGHVHVSEPLLGDFSQPWEGHQELSRILTNYGYKGNVSLEMKRPSSGLEGIRDAISFVRDCYGTS